MIYRFDNSMAVGSSVLPMSVMRRSFVMRPLGNGEVGAADVMAWCECSVALALRDGMFLLESFIARLRLRRAFRCN